MTAKNPKFENSNIIDCKPQKGLCPVNCNQCFYNRPDAFYMDINESLFPTLEEVGDKIVRINSGHDSNIEKKFVIESTEQYKNRFFNTSLFVFDFPAPVVFTANSKEEQMPNMPATYNKVSYDNLMFIRLRVSSTNLKFIDEAVVNWTKVGVPVVLTFMAYYEYEPKVPEQIKIMVESECYQWRVRTLNSYWCATPSFVEYVLDREKKIAKKLNRLVTVCGGKEIAKCSQCKNCETYYWQTIKRMRGE